MKTVTMEELLSWAFVHELPKGGGVDGLANMNSAWRMLQASSWGKVTRFAELMTLVDAGWREGGNVFIEQGEPHADALAVGRAVAGLAARSVILPEGWNPLGDWEVDPRAPDLSAEAVARALARWRLASPLRRSAALVNLVVSSAVLGRAPDWRADRPTVRMVTRGGKPAWFIRREMRDNFGVVYMAEVDGYNQRAGRPVRGAYRRYEFAADPSIHVLSRLDWQVWVGALGALEEELGPVLVGHRLRRVARSPQPWMRGRGQAVAVAVAAGEALEKTA